MFSTSVRALLLSATVLTSLAVAGCNEAAIKDFAPKASMELSPALISKMSSMGMERSAPIMARIFKEEGKLEIWKQKTNGQYGLLAQYDICKWSGQLGPKYIEGDRQAPEGFYTIRPAQMNPNSSYYLAFNMGYPNAYDRANGRTGSNLMVHGACSSSGCYSMTDAHMGQIYALGRDAFKGGQTEFQIQAFPFRMTAENMARYRNDPNFKFWQMLKEGYDRFDLTKVPPKVDVCEKRYVFDRAKAGTTLSPTGACPADSAKPELETAYKSYQTRYDAAFEVATKKSSGHPLRPTMLGLDEAKLVADWTHKRSRGERITVEPPDMRVDGSVTVTSRMGRIDSDVGRKMAAREAEEAEKKRIAEEQAATVAAAKAIKAAEKAAKEQQAAAAKQAEQAATAAAAAPPPSAPVAAQAESATVEETSGGLTGMFGSVRKRITNIF